MFSEADYLVGCTFGFTSVTGTAGALLVLLTRISRSVGFCCGNIYPHASNIIVVPSVRAAKVCKENTVFRPFSLVLPRDGLFAQLRGQTAEELLVG